MISTLMRWAMLVVVTLSTQLLTSGCAQAPAESEKTGVLAAALTTTSSGATYAFPPGTYLVTTSPYYEFIPLDGPDALLIKSLPVGAYTAEMYFSSGVTELDQTVGMTTNRVPATWTNPQPMTFNITEGVTTSLELTFEVVGFGQVTFARGSVNISLHVTNVTGGSNGAIVSGTTSLYSEEYADPMAAYASELDVDVPGDYPFSLQVHATNAWFQNSSFSICRYTDGAVASTSAAGGFAKRLEQVQGTDGNLCIFDYGANDVVVVAAYRYGAPPASQAMFLPGSNYSFQVYTSTTVGDVFDGGTLNEVALQAATPGDVYFDHVVYDYDANAIIARASGSSVGSIQLLP